MKRDCAYITVCVHCQPPTVDVRSALPALVASLGSIASLHLAVCTCGFLRSLFLLVIEPRAR